MLCYSSSTDPQLSEPFEADCAPRRHLEKRTQTHKIHVFPKERTSWMFLAFHICSSSERQRRCHASQVVESIQPHTSLSRRITLSPIVLFAPDVAHSKDLCDFGKSTLEWFSEGRRKDIDSGTVDSRSTWITPRDNMWTPAATHKMEMILFPT